METNVIYNEECLQGMSERIPDHSIDMILADLPYGMTDCEWDSEIPLEPLWEQYKRISKSNTAIVLTSSQPFSSRLIQSNPKWFKYEWIWKKNRGSNFGCVKWQPMKEHENILIFGKGKTKYNPIKEKRKGSGKERVQYDVNYDTDAEVYGDGSIKDKMTANLPDKRYPSSVQKFNTEVGLHPTQKPVSLFKYLIETYTNQGGIVLDNVIGSGTTAVAAKTLGRKYIGFEQDEEYYEIAVERTKEVQKELLTQQ